MKRGRKKKDIPIWKAKSKEDKMTKQDEITEEKEKKPPTDQRRLNLYMTPTKQKKTKKRNKTRRRREDACLLSLSLRHLSSLHGRHLLRPALSGLGFLNGAKVIGGEAGDAHVVVAFQDELDVAEFEGGGRAEFG